MHLLSFFVQLHTWLSCLPVSVTFGREINHEGIFWQKHSKQSKERRHASASDKSIHRMCLLKKHREFHSILQHSFSLAHPLTSRASWGRMSRLKERLEERLKEGDKLSVRNLFLREVNSTFYLTFKLHSGHEKEEEEGMKREEHTWRENLGDSMPFFIL